MALEHPPRFCQKCGEQLPKGENAATWALSHVATGKCTKNQFENKLRMEKVSDLNDLLEAQARLQLKMPQGKDPRDLATEDKALFIKDMTLALTDELHELLAEVGWKPWASSRHVHVDSARGELIDALHFFLNLALALDMDGFMIMEMYHAKHKKNQQRQEEGYDGVASKCGYCRRALDDEDKLLSAGEEGCWRSGDGNTGYCREAGLQVVNDFICPECTLSFRFADSIVHNDYVTVECSGAHQFIVPKGLAEGEYL